MQLMATSGLDCLVLVANLCLHSVTTVEIHDSGLGARAEIRGHDFEGDIVLRSDNIFTPDWSRMNNACVEGACVAYFKHCVTSDGAITCDYHFSQPGETQNTLVSISAKNGSELQSAEESIGVLTRSGWTFKEVPLSTFTKVSDEATPPYCKHRVPQSACWPAVK